MDCLVLPLIGFAIGIVAVIIQQVSKSNAVRKIGGIERIQVGKYLGGLSNVNLRMNNCDCVVTEADLVFINGSGVKIGRIPRDAIREIILDDKTQISQRLTVTRMLTLGVFSLATPKKKKHKEYCLLFDWEDDEGTRQNTVFELSGAFSDTQSYTSVNKLRKYLKPELECLKADEKKCPYCAEIIKREAKVCRYCQRQV